MVKVSEIVFEPDYTTEQFEKAKTWLVERQPDFGRTANFCIIHKKGIESCDNNPCHGAIMNPPGGPRFLVGTENGAKRSSKDVSVTIPFLKWFLYESYMGRFILNRDDFDFCRDYGFIVSADVYTPLMQNVLITTRHFYEVQQVAFEDFNKLLEKGVSGALAYQFTMLGGRSIGGPLNNLVYSQGGHRAHCLPKTLDGLKAFLNEEVDERTQPVNDKKKHFRLYANYNGGVSLFYPYAGFSSRDHFLKDLLKKDEDFLTFVRKMRGQDGLKAYTPPNPFAPKYSYEKNPDDFTYEEVYDHVLPYLMETKPWLK